MILYHNTERTLLASPLWVAMLILVLSTNWHSIFMEATRSGKFTIDDPNAKTTSLKPRTERTLLNGSRHVYDLRGRLVKQRKHRGVYLTR